MEPREHRYAVPLTTLVAGAYVPLAEQVEVHDLATPPPPGGGLVVPAFADGGGGDADGD